MGTTHVHWHDTANPDGYPFDTLWQWALDNTTPAQRGDVELPPYDPDTAGRLVFAHANPSNTTAGSKYNEATKVHGCLKILANSGAVDDYHDWLRVGFALHEAGYPVDVWDAWSRGSSKHVPGCCEQRWRGFGKGKGKRVGLGTLVAMAKAVDPTWLRPKEPPYAQAMAALKDALPPAAPPLPGTPPEAPLGVWDDLKHQASKLEGKKNTPENWRALLQAAGAALGAGAIDQINTDELVRLAREVGLLSANAAKAVVREARKEVQQNLAQGRQQERQQQQHDRALAVGNPARRAGAGPKPRQ